MKGVVSAEFYKVMHNKLLWCLPVFFAAVGFFYASYDYRVFGLYNGLEFFAAPTLVYWYVFFGIAIMTGYMVGLDFSAQTIKNVISVGIARGTYFFSRLGVQLLLSALLYGLTILAYAVGRMVFHPVENVRPEMELFWAKLVVFIVVSILQVWAEAAVVNAVCHFVKKQLPAIGASLLLVYTEMVIRQIADMYGILFVRGIFDFTPVRVLKSIFEKYVIYDRVLTFGFLKYGISALFIIIVSSAAGFIKFRYFPGSDSL